MDTTAAPAAFASSGKISGTGFAHAKMIGSFAIVRTISCVSVPGADTPMKMSAPLITSARVPFSLLKFVILAISSLIGFNPSLPS